MASFGNRLTLSDGADGRVGPFDRSEPAEPLDRERALSVVADPAGTGLRHRFAHCRFVISWHKHNGLILVAASRGRLDGLGRSLSQPIAEPIVHPASCRIKRGVWAVDGQPLAHTTHHPRL